MNFIPLMENTELVASNHMQIINPACIEGKYLCKLEDLKSIFIVHVKRYTVLFWTSRGSASHAVNGFMKHACNASACRGCSKVKLRQTT